MTDNISRVGIIFGDLKGLEVSALSFLILHLNVLQNQFEFEILPKDSENPLVKALNTKEEISRVKVYELMNDFPIDYTSYIEENILSYQCSERAPENYVVITMARFSDNFYSLRKNKLSILAMGNWERIMAPPSIVEFILILLVREVVAFISPTLYGHVHLGTKGCLFDFTMKLNEVRYKVLNSFICNYCREALKNDGYPDLAKQLECILGKHWLGNPDKHESPASITRKLGYDLFLTKGIKPTAWENVVQVLSKEGVKQVLTIIGTVAAAALIFILGFTSN